MKLNDKLKELDSYPFHMPGHKRNHDFGIVGADIDITEIEGFDNLHKPEAILSELEKRTAKIFKSKKSILSVNGSTCCILSAISAVCKKGDTIIIARNCHKSVYNACFINELNTVYAEPEFCPELGIYTKITQATIDSAIKNNPTAKAIVITSPTYEGTVSEIKADIPIIIDAAHGSHFGFAEFLPSQAQGDLVIHSLHKTLPSLTQTAVIHIHNEKYAEPVKKYMDIFESSSPSYVLLASIEKCIDFLENSQDAFHKYEMLLNVFYQKLKTIKNIEVFSNDDPTRIIVSAKGYSGAELSAHLRQNGIEPEGCGMNYVILISTVCDTEKGFEILIHALNSLESREKQATYFNKLSLPEKKYNTFEIENTVQTVFKKSAGKISGEYVFAYPPGVPIIAPGEIISNDVIGYIEKSIEKGVNIISDSNLLPHSILTKYD